MMNPNERIHFLESSIELPEKFTFPFQYTPHPITKIAVKHLQSYLENQTDFNGNFDVLGKMFGVLIVETPDKKTAYLAGFSGKINDSVLIDGFVPPIFDTLNPNGFYKKGEAELTLLNQKIDAFEKSKEYLNFKERLKKLHQKAEIDIQNFKKDIKTKKKERDLQRLEIQKLPTEKRLKEEQKLKNESIRLNYLFKDLKRDFDKKISNLKNQLTDFEKPLHELKKRRKKQSAELQNRLHQQYKMLNAKGEYKNLLDIFEMYPPAGAGECALPKLLHYAYQHDLKPIAMGEFWWGKSPASELKIHKQFYPSCKSKCKPILKHMLDGLSVDENPVKNRENIKLDIIFEDESIVVINKPYGFLSVDGAEIKDSVASRMQKYLPNATGMLMVHRLDMATSGIMVVAKTAEIHKNLQQQFTERTVKKRYVAILEGILKEDTGIINLPLRVDYHNRPRQLVCYDSGKKAITRFKVIERFDNKTKVYLFPETGRTHQLRVHCAHQKGLKTPILGDVLYGNPNKRLYLHAESLKFTHPKTHKKVSFFVKPNF